jgi:hypothetical protein
MSLFASNKLGETLANVMLNLVRVKIKVDNLSLFPSLFRRCEIAAGFTCRNVPMRASHLLANALTSEAMIPPIITLPGRPISIVYVFVVTFPPAVPIIVFPVGINLSWRTTFVVMQLPVAPVSQIALIEHFCKGVPGTKMSASVTSWRSSPPCDLNVSAGIAMQHHE